jgi:hypothetical protein
MLYIYMDCRLNLWFYGVSLAKIGDRRGTKSCGPFDLSQRLGLDSHPV